MDGDLFDGGESTLPGDDEGWWTAVILEEKRWSPFSDEIDSEPHKSHPVKIDWELPRNLMKQDEIITLEVRGYNRGGLLVQGDQLQGFVPLSHLLLYDCNSGEEERRAQIISYVGSRIELKVIECDPGKDRIVFSERAAKAGCGKRKEIISNIQVGDIVEGCVTNITDFGVFLDLGGVEGLIHLSELSWGRVYRGCEIVRIGETLRVIVLSVNADNARIALSLKRLEVNPWESIAEKYHPGDVVPATVTTITGFGAFARLAEGVEGLIHISTLKPPAGAAIGDILKPGQCIHVKILHLDIEKRRLGFGLVHPE
jgi:small subunit ribosomal protein S1